MSWRDAPLYVEAHDLARWAEERSSGHSSDSLGAAASNLRDLLCAVSLALTFPVSRDRHLEAADEAVVRARVMLRLARDVGAMSAGGHRHASGRLLVIGRMIGGWRKRRARGPRSNSGSSPPAARTV